jgi:hypothetical protein
MMRIFSVHGLVRMALQQVNLFKEPPPDSHAEGLVVLLSDEHLHRHGFRPRVPPWHRYTGERLNADLKHVIRRKVPARSKTKLRAAIEEQMTIIGSEPERVEADFRDPNVKYAACDCLRAQSIEARNLRDSYYVSPTVPAA